MDLEEINGIVCVQMEKAEEHLICAEGFTKGPGAGVIRNFLEVEVW